MKTKLAYIITLLFFISCSSNDDDIEQPTINIALLYGQWFHIDLCETQNSLQLNSNNTYTHTYSGNTCDNNENNTYQFTGTFSVSGNNLILNQQSETVIEEGEGNVISIGEEATLIYQKIITLTETELFIERKLNNGQDYFSNWHLTK